MNLLRKVSFLVRKIKPLELFIVWSFYRPVFKLLCVG